MNQDIIRVKRSMELVKKKIEVELERHSHTHQLTNLKDTYHRYRSLLMLCTNILPAHNPYIINMINYFSISLNEAYESITYLEELINIELTIITNGENLFSNSKEELKLAAAAFEKDDSLGLHAHLAASVEIALKDKLSIPTTIRNINVFNILQILEKEKVLKLYCREVYTKVFDESKNPAQHQGYKPSKRESLDAIKSVEEFLKKLEETDTPEIIKEEIYDSLIKKK